MTELLISEITRMGAVFCVAGLERAGEGFRTVRPVHPDRHGWFPLPGQRGERVVFRDQRGHPPPAPVVAPHTEDRAATSHESKGAVSEEELVRSLKRAEVASSVKELFACRVHAGYGGEAVFAEPAEAQRSLCGCEIAAISFSFKRYPASIRVALALSAGEPLASLPLVDHDYQSFVARLARGQADGPVLRERLDRFFDSCVVPKIMASSFCFARIGLPRTGEDKHCWLMLDSVFPLPQAEWMENWNASRA